MTTYSIMNRRGEIEQSGLGRIDAAKALLTRGGGHYEIAFDYLANRYALFWGWRGQNKRLVPHLFSCAPTPEAAREDILSQVVTGREWRGGVVASDDYCAWLSDAPKAEARR